MQRVQRLRFRDGDGRWRHMTVFRAGASRDYDRNSLQMAHRLEEINRAHDIGLESLDWICPGQSGEALRTEMEDVCRLRFGQELCNPLTVPQIALGESDIR